MIENGADINSHDNERFDKNTPLNSASFWGYVNIVKYLVECGANLHLVNEAGKLYKNNFCNSDLNGEEYFKNNFLCFEVTC